MDNQVLLLESSSFSYARSAGHENEDTILPAIQSGDAIFFALADGVGGHKGGDVASKAVISAVRSRLLTWPNMHIEQVFRLAKERLEQLSTQDTTLEKMATTLIVCKISSKGIEVANVGDSRAYLVEGNTLKQLTTDHTQKQQLIDRGTFTAKELKDHRSGNRLTNSLQTAHDYKLDIFKSDISQGAVLLMSDGTYKSIEHTRVVGNDGSDDLLNICRNIKKRVLKHGPGDDYSLVAARFKLHESEQDLKVSDPNQNTAVGGNRSNGANHFKSFTPPPIQLTDQHKQAMYQVVDRATTEAKATSDKIELLKVREALDKCHRYLLTADDPITNKLLKSIWHDIQTLPQVRNISSQVVKVVSKVMAILAD